MKYRKFNKYERKQIRGEQIKTALHGEGLYLYENNSDADLTLPRPTASGLRKVVARGQFQGDNYYMQMVRTNDLKLIQTIQSPDQQKEANMSHEEKLILDQPDMITEQGKVEHVATDPPQKLNEEDDSTPQPDVLINEDPGADSFVIVE
jgi:hypothetical protein